VAEFDSARAETEIYYPLQLPHGRLKRALKLGLGRSLLALFPARGARVLAEGDPADYGWLDRQLLAGHLARARASGDFTALASVQKRFWAGRGGQLFNSVRDVANRFEQWFLGPHYAVVEALAAEIGNGSGFERLVELGSGNGLALNHLAGRFTGLPRLIGVDLNPAAARDNPPRFGNPRLAFEHADVVAWIAEQATPRTVWFSNAGVLEYLREAEVSGIYQRIAEAGAPAVVALVEPAAFEHDLARVTASEVNPQEHSHSHNHRHLLTQAGFTTRYASEVHLAGSRWVMLVATLQPQQDTRP
jgi:uncharacterized glyoxalase superfamily protein PhnB